MPTDRVRSYSIDLKPRRHHGYAVLLFILGTLVPPLGTFPGHLSYRTIFIRHWEYAAVAARFGIGTDFWINVVLTICGYIPGTSSLHTMFTLALPSYTNTLAFA